MVATPWMANVLENTLVNSVDEGAVITLSAAAASTVNSAIRYNPRAAMRVVIDLTTVTTATVTVTVLGYDQASGKTWTLLASAGLTTAATTILYVTPSIAASANVIAQAYAGPFYQISVGVVGGGAAVTGTVSVHLLGD